MHILVVDDDAVSRLVLEHMVRTAGHEVSVAQSVGEALAVLHQHSIDLVLCDYEMPEANGLDLLDGIRAADADQPAPHFALVTGTLEKSELDDPRVVNVDAYLTKPVTTSAVEDVLTSLPARSV